MAAEGETAVSCGPLPDDAPDDVVAVDGAVPGGAVVDGTVIGGAAAGGGAPAPARPLVEPCEELLDAWDPELPVLEELLDEWDPELPVPAERLVVRDAARATGPERPTGDRNPIPRPMPAAARARSPTTIAATRRADRLRLGLAA